MKKIYSIITITLVLFTTNLFSQDLGLSYVGPTGNTCNMSSTEYIDVVIINNFAGPYAGTFTVSYSLNNAAYISETYGPFVMGGSTTYNYTFLTPADFSACQTHELVIVISTGMIAENDTITNFITNYCSPTFTVVGSEPALTGTDGEVYCTVAGGAPTYTYLWTNLTTFATNNTDSWIGLAPAQYSILVTDANGCMADSIVEVFIGSLSIENDLNSEHNIFYVDGFLTIQSKSQLVNSACLIYDASGKILSTINLTNPITNIEIELQKGIYLYQIVDASNAVLANGKFVASLSQ